MPALKLPVNRLGGESRCTPRESAIEAVFVNASCGQYPCWIMALPDLSRVKAYDLGQPYFTGMPHHPSHPPFLYGLTKKHGDIVYAEGSTSAADAIAFGTHVGTHIDALSHFSCNGIFHGGRSI